MAGRLKFRPTVSLTVTTIAQELIPANPKRVYFLFANRGNRTVRLSADAAPPPGGGIPVPAGGNYEPLHVPINSFWIVADAGTQACTFQEADGS